MEYYGISEKEYDLGKRYLPSDIGYEEYIKFWQKTFGEDPRKYEVVCSKGLKFD